MKQLGLGVVGAGGIARNGHMAGARYAAEVRPVACSDVDITKADALAADFCMEKAYTDYAEVISHPGVNAVLVCTPPKFHKEIAVSAARAGKHVLCEKPMALNVAEAQEMIDAARENNVLLVVGEPKRYNPGFRKMKSIIDEGVIGEPFMARYHNSYCELHTRSSWWVVPEISGGGERMNELTHQANTLRWFFGEVIEVTCMSNHPLGPPPEDNACVSARFENGVIATITVSWMTRHYNLTFPAPLDHAWDERIEVFGKEGSVIIETPIGYWDVPAQLRVYTEKEVPGYINGWSYVKVGSANNFTDQMRHFADCVLNGTPSEVPGEEGLADLAMVRAAYESEETGKTVKLR
ncbi:MAG: hypothetical protein A2Z18_10510 [Armatimonadetes bacterium RBG_16_58_9]|nr:MAG: hypothetical protein A2Z18_10510 [Armatimonadetes bacterium RBG_16_58_9]